MNNLNSLPIKTIWGFVFIKKDDIILLKAERKNTLVFIDGDKKPIIARCSIGSLKEKLPNDFYQCHRSYIINLTHIALYEYKSKIIKMSNEIEVRLYPPQRIHYTKVSFYR